MKIKNFISLLLLLGFILSLLVLPGLANQEKAQEAETIIIPKKVKNVFQEGLETRQARLDIPFTIIKYIFLPARQNLQSIFFFKVKNADFGFSPITPAPETTEKKQKEEKEKISPPESETTPSQLQASGHLFLQFNRLEDGSPKELVKEVYIPVNLQVESASYEPDKEELYSTAYPLPPGNYLLSMAIASMDLERIGTQYFEFFLPDPLSFTDELGTTPIFFAKEIKRMTSPETTAEIHKDFFTYSVLQIEPNIDQIFPFGKNLDIFFFVFGAQPTEEGKYNIEVSYEVLKGEEKVIRFALANYDSPIVSQPLPMKKTVIIKSETEGEKKEQRDLEPGKYTLHMKITDKVSGYAVEKNVDFEIKKEEISEGLA